MKSNHTAANFCIALVSIIVGVIVCEAASRLFLNPADYLSAKTIDDKVLGITIAPNSSGFDECRLYISRHRESTSHRRTPMVTETNRIIPFVMARLSFIVVASVINPADWNTRVELKGQRLGLEVTTFAFHATARHFLWEMISRTHFQSPMGWTPHRF